MTRSRACAGMHLRLQVISSLLPTTTDSLNVVCAGSGAPGTPTLECDPITDVDESGDDDDVVLGTQAASPPMPVCTRHHGDASSCCRSWRGGKRPKLGIAPCRM